MKSTINDFSIQTKMACIPIWKPIIYYKLYSIVMTLTQKVHNPNLFICCIFDTGILNICYKIEINIWKSRLHH